MRNGTGTPSLCRACRIAVEHAAARGQTRTGRAQVQVGNAFEKVADLAHEVLDDIFAGKPFNKQKVASTIKDTIWEMGGGSTDFHPPVQDVPLDPFGNGQPINEDDVRRARRG